MWFLLLFLAGTLLGLLLGFKIAQGRAGRQHNEATQLLEQQQQQLNALKNDNSQLTQKTADLQYQIGELKKDLAAAKR